MIILLIWTQIEIQFRQFNVAFSSCNMINCKRTLSPTQLLKFIGQTRLYRVKYILRHFLNVVFFQNQFPIVSYFKRLLLSPKFLRYVALSIYFAMKKRFYDIGLPNIYWSIYWFIFWCAHYVLLTYVSFFFKEVFIFQIALIIHFLIV